MTETAMLEDMIKLQKEVDQNIFEAHGMNGYDDISIIDLNRAILDEIGELNHELKPNWCWWKKCQPVDKARVLEEFVDVIHFVLMRAIKSKQEKHLVNGFGCCSYVPDECPSYSMLLSINLNDPGRMFTDGCILSLVTEELGLTWPEVYEAYRAKNAINHQRVKEGY